MIDNEKSILQKDYTGPLHKQINYSTNELLTGQSSYLILYTASVQVF